ncbi:IS3 family transposase [Cellulosispirillum alkaliphilum]|uniref:IS3 family transposase n=1 Tax=Cellulosispirillum alkaliphilum TaxID=3039283 RepID=UPI003D6F7495
MILFKACPGKVTVGIMLLQSPFSIYKTELVYHEAFTDRQHVLSSTFEYIEHYYNRKRRHSATGYLSPVDFENHFKKAA